MTPKCPKCAREIHSLSISYTGPNLAMISCPHCYVLITVVPRSAVGQ